MKQIEDIDVIRDNTQKRLNIEEKEKEFNTMKLHFLQATMVRMS